MPEASKRRAIGASSSSPRKRQKTELQTDGQPDDLQNILAQIKAQEESEALARRLQDEWNENQAGSSSQTIDNTQQESDEVMARRLADEWSQEIGDIPGDILPASSSSRTTRDELREDAPSSLLDPSSATVRVGEDVSPEKALIRHRQFFTGTRQCTKCGAGVQSPRGFVTFSTSIPPPSVLSLLHAPCKSCRTNHCRGCFQPLSCPKTCRGKQPCSVEHCCAEIRAIAVFETLAGFDRQYLGEQEISSNRAKAALDQTKKSAVGTVGPGGTGYSTGSRGSSYGPHNTRRSHASTSHISTKFDRIAAHWDEIVIRALKVLVYFLPSPYSESPQMYDMVPHSSLKDLLLLSQLPELLGSLLRNDSVTDWIKRPEVYHAMLDLLRRLADTELTIDVLISPRWDKDRSPGLESWMWDEDVIEWSTTPDGEAIERSPPLYEHFRKLTRQCEAFVNGASQIIDGGADDQVEEMTVTATSLCGDIIAAGADVERVMAALRKSASRADSLFPIASGKGKGRDASFEMEKAYNAACERHALKHAILGTSGRVGKNEGYLYPEYAYAKELENSASATRNPKDRLHLVKELAIMATGLPPGVWMRIDEVRNDAIKIMIAGPESTPYAGGLFEFDCFMPLQYPQSPPLMHLRTTGGGTVRFNPNLYNTGKVCLSLLGTWPGSPEEQWRPGKSTLLQVLVSIQAMILVAYPFFNEPGFGQVNPNSPQSISYNRNITLQTTHWAIVDWLKPKHRHGLWADVIKSHFTIRREKIRACIQEWAQQEASLKSYVGHVGMFEQGIREIESWVDVVG